MVCILAFLSCGSDSRSTAITAGAHLLQLVVVELARHGRTIRSDRLAILDPIEVDIPYSVQRVDRTQKKDNEAEVQRVVQSPRDGYNAADEDCR